jgi:hypothetical protein
MRLNLHPDDKERLIQLVVQEVMAAMLKGAETPGRSVKSTAETNPVIRCNDRLLTAAGLKALVGDSRPHVFIDSACIVTPAAMDVVRELRITLERGVKPLQALAAAPPADKNVALVSRFLLKMQWQAIGNALSESKWNGVAMNLPAAARDLEPQLDLIGNGLRKKELHAAIIFDDHINLLYTRLQRRDGLMPVIGWSKEAVARARVSAQANVLLLDNRSFGVRKLQELITVWLSTGRSE